MRCSIVIRSFNEQKHIGRLLAGIREQSVQDCEVIVVDSGSTDGTAEIAQEQGAKVVHIQPSEFSFGHALNVGCREAVGDILVFASAHVYPVSTLWLEHLLAPFDDTKVVLTYGRQTGNEATKYAEHRIFQKWFPNQSDFDQKNPFCNNANAAVRRSVWQEHPYDVSLTGLEDLDWASRLMTLGNRIAYVADATVVHVHEETLARIYNRYRREAIALKAIRNEQRFSFVDFFRLWVGNSLSDLCHSVKDRVLFKKFSEIILFRLMQFWGTYRGFHHRGEVDSVLRQRFYYPNSIRTVRETKEPKPSELIDYASLGYPANAEFAAATRRSA